MGNSTSSDGPVLDPLDSIYNAHWGKFLVKGGDESADKDESLGGSDITGQTFVEFGGGYSAMEDYGNSVYSSAKEKLIRGIASDVAETLKIKQSWADTASIKDVVEKLQKIVPDPKHKRSIKGESHIHKELCTRLAKAINKRYDMNVVNMDADPSIMCNQVSEVLYALFAGLHSEFLTVSGDVSRIIRNLRVLQEYVNEVNKKLIDILNKNAEGSDPEAESIRKLYDTLAAEIDRQEVILTTLTNSVIGPVGESLVTLLEDNEDFKGLTNDLEKLTGTTEFGDKLGFLLKGTANVSHAAEVVDKALKKIGLTVKDYKNVTGIKELRGKIIKEIEKKKPTSGELYKLLAAADVIYKHDINHEDILKHLEKKSGGFASSGGISSFEMAQLALEASALDPRSITKADVSACLKSVSASRKGGADDFTTSYTDPTDLQTSVDADDNPFKGRTQSSRKSISKQLEQKKHLRKQLFSVLNEQIKDRYNKIKFTLTKLGKKIGVEIDLTPELDMFIRQLNNFSDAQPDRHNLHIALSGFRKDIGSDFVKYQFMENLHAIVESAEDMEKTKSGQYFKEIKNSVVELLDVIYKFNETFTNTLSDIHVENVGVKAKGGDCGCAGGDEGDEFDLKPSGGELPEELESVVGSAEPEDVVEGGSALATALGGVVSFISENEFNHFKTMKKSIREIDYYYRIAGIKANMNKVSLEFDNNADNYENILGEEAGYYIDKIQQKYNDLISATDTDTEDPKNVEKLYCHGREAQGAGLPDTLKTSVGKSFKDREDYIKANTPDANKKSKDLETLKGQLDGYKFLLEYIRTSKIEMLEAAQALDIYLSKFTKSIQFKPDQIKEFVQILEQIEVVAKWFTDKSGDNLVTVFEEFGGIKLNGPEHYYKQINNKAVGEFRKNKLMTRDEVIEFVKKIEKSIKSVRALENIIATFSRVNTNVSAEVKTFMSSGTMFKAFMNYAIASVISVGYLVLDNDKKILKGYLNNDTTVGGDHNTVKQLKAKIGVSLQFNKTDMQSSDNEYLQLCDPLDIDSTMVNGKFVDPCDKIYEMCIKSLIAKVFTIVGSYTLFNKPAKMQENSLSLSNNPLRQILGGAPSHTKIIPEATELYLRLPLLVEWYRSVFEFNASKEYVGKEDEAKYQQDPLISVIPDMDSIWGDLCKVIFIDAGGIGDGSYPTEYANRIIESINSIYTHYKAKHSNISVREIIMEFVLEINRRYGLIMRSEITRYLDERSSYIKITNIDEEYPDEDNVEYNLVDIEANIGRRPAPSDKFRAFQKKTSTRKYGLQDLFNVVKRFRESVDANLTLATPTRIEDSKNVSKNADYFRTIANVSLTGIIGETKKKINAAQSSEDKYQIIHEQLHGVDKFGDIDQQKILLFHETVITPLTILYFTYRILNYFNRFAISLDVTKSEPRFKGKGTQNSFRTDNNIINIGADDKATNLTFAGINSNPDDNKMEELLRRLMNIGCDMNGLTEINFVGGGETGNYPYIVYDKLEETCSNLFNNAKSAFHQLRKFLPSSLISQYENPGNSSDDNVINLFYIQEQLFDRLFGNKYGNGLVDANISIKDAWTDLVKDLNSHNKTFSKLGFWGHTKTCRAEPIKEMDQYKFPYKFIPIFSSGSSLGNPISKEEKDAISRFTTGDFTYNNTSKPPKNDMVSLNKNIAIMLQPGDNAFYNTGDGTYNMYLGTRHLYSDIKDNASLGLICKLNNLIYKYCSIFTDPATSKIYKPLIEKFVNGHNAKDILDGKNINDSVYYVYNDVHNAKELHPYIINTEPVEGAVLFASLAGGLKGMLYSMADKTFGVTNVYTEESFLKINDYQKELMRANLPAFEKELSLIIKKAEFLQRCLEETKVNVKSDAYTPTNVITVHLDVEKYTQKNGYVRPAQPTEVRKTYLVGIFDDISSTAKSLKRCIDDVQKELNDVPKYFEVYQDSIVDYNNYNKRLPFMPISHVTNLMNFKLQKKDGKYNLPLIPNVDMGAGSSQYKFTYGTRGLLHYKQESSMEFAPGVEALLTSYNEKMGGAASFDKSKMAHIVTGSIVLSRFVLDFMYHKQALDKSDWDSMEKVLPKTIQNLSCQARAKYTPAITATTTTLATPEIIDVSTWYISNVLALVENDSHKQVMNRMISWIVDPKKNTLTSMARTEFRVYNILDLNIVPINVHAMQREIPFVNLLNYSFTFDNIVKNFIGKDYKSAALKTIEDKDMYTDIVTRNDVDPKDAMVRQIIYPLGVRPMFEYTHNTFRIMTGTTSLNLNRPKYLSDQLWNKVLLNSIYDNDINKPIGFVKKNSGADISDNFTHLGKSEQLSETLNYIKDGKLETTGVTINNIGKTTFEGYVRYNTKLVRWIEWFVQCQRVIRMLMRSQLEWISDPVVQGNDAISKDVTEYRDVNTFTLGDFE